MGSEMCIRDSCYINIAYNAQVPLCVAEASGTWSRWLGNASAPEAAAPMRCRDALALCEADPDFRLDFAPGSPLLARVPLDEVVAGETQLLLADDIGTRVLPVPLRVGDYNMDGYPDVAVITVPRGALDITLYRDDLAGKPPRPLEDTSVSYTHLTLPTNREV